MGEPRRVLVLGGTGEGAALARALAGRDDVEVISSLAGATRNPATLPGTVRRGGFGGSAGLMRFITGEHIDLVIDATHPYAGAISAHAATASAGCGTRLLRVARPPWQAPPGARWVEVEDVEAAARRLPALGRRALLTLGRRALAPFAVRPGLWCLARFAEPPVPAIAHGEALVARGPFTLDAERDLLHRHRIDVVVTRNSGGEATRAKIDAAAGLGIPLLVVRRPPRPPAVDEVTDVDQALSWLDPVLAEWRRSGGGDGDTGGDDDNGDGTDDNAPERTSDGTSVGQ